MEGESKPLTAQRQRAEALLQSFGIGPRYTISYTEAVNAMQLFARDEARAAASDDGAARPQPAQGKGAKVTCACGGKLLWSPVRGVLCENCTDPNPPLSSPSVAQGWTALDGFNLDRIEQTLKTLGAITQDDAHWLIGKLTKAVTPSTPAGAAQTKNETS